MPTFQNYVSHPTYLADAPRRKNLRVREASFLFETKEEAFNRQRQQIETWLKKAKSKHCTRHTWNA